VAAAAAAAEPKVRPVIGKVTDYIENEECFKVGNAR